MVHRREFLMAMSAAVSTLALGGCSDQNAGSHGRRDTFL